jgi:hypothetical protein
MDKLEEATEPEEKKPMHFVLAFLLTLPLAGAGYVVDQAVRWTDHLQGLVNGLFHMLFLSMAWPIYMLPWCLAVYFSYRKRKSKKNRTLWIMGPAMLMSLFTLGMLVFQPPSAARRFESFTKTKLPENLTDLETHFSGGGIADYGDTYYFKTSSAEIDRLIREMKLEEDKYYSAEESSYSMIKALPNCPDYGKWVGAKKYTGWDDREHWFYHLIADSSKTQAYIFVGCT